MRTLIAVLAISVAALFGPAYSKDLPSLSDCNEHLTLCLSTDLGAYGSGGNQGSSICKDCFNLCHGQGTWPDSVKYVTQSDSTCKWWTRSGSGDYHGF
jgi:hypothetical protein